MKPKHEKMLASKSTHYKTSRGLEHATVILKDNVDTLEVSTVLPFMSYLLLTLTTCVYSHLLLTLQQREMLMQAIEATENNLLTNNKLLLSNILELHRTISKLNSSIVDLRAKLIEKGNE